MEKEIHTLGRVTGTIHPSPGGETAFHHKWLCHCFTIPEPVLSISATPCKHFSTGFSAEWRTQLIAVKPYFWSCPCNHAHSCLCAVCNFFFALIKGWEFPDNISLEELQPENSISLSTHVQLYSNLTGNPRLIC